MAQMDIQQSYNPFTQRQTMYLDSTGTTPFGQQQQLQMHQPQPQPQPQPQQQLQQTQLQQLQQFGSGGGGGIANITSPFAGVNANSIQTGNNAGQFLASPFGTSQPQQQQLQQHQQTSVHALQNTLNNGNFADFNFFQ
ncbi:hypothetical protein GGF37_003175 [Kickxella alabastrina]|nr:hypothetical protein GGF37_003175 [Kickxella alabastrina]